MVVDNSVGKIRILHIENPSRRSVYIKSWSKATTINFSKYNIKETDLRIKTATFSSPDYIDLTTGMYAILISSKYHENFSGIILDVDYDPSTGLYNYQCQDWSRTYLEKWSNTSISPRGKRNLYTILLDEVSRAELFRLHNKNLEKRKKKSNVNTTYKFTSAEKAKFQNTLSGIRPLWKYDQSIYNGNKYKGNPFKKIPKIYMGGKTHIEIIRNLVFSQLGYYDVWFNDRGILQIEPLSKTDWETTGLHLTTPQMASQKYKFSTTNAITQVFVDRQGKEAGTSYWSTDLGMNLDLTMFFGWQGASMSDPTQKDKNTSNATKTTTTTTVNSENPYGTKNKVVYMNIDLIDGYSSDQNKMDKMCDLLKKQGWECHTCGVGSESHYQRRGEVKGGIWLTLYGGACAGTLRETAKNDWFRRPIVNNGSRTVVGFFPPCGDIRKGGKYYSWLPRAHDDGFSGNFSGISHPAQMLTDCAIPFMYASNPSEMVTKFLKGGDNPEACNKNWKFISK